MDLFTYGENMREYASGFVPPDFSSWRFYVTEMIVTLQIALWGSALALWIHTTGTLAKLFSEAVEVIDPQPIEGILATGARKIEEIAYGVIPQVLPLWISYSLYRFEANIRSASVVGMI